MNLQRASPLRYAGGKSKLLNLIISLIIENKLRGHEYIEPYIGGGGLALGLLFSGYVSKIHINDIDIGVYYFWKQIINETDLFIDIIKNTPVTLKEWRNQKERYNNPMEQSPTSLAFATFYLSRCNFSGILTGGPIGGLEQKGKYKIDCRFNKIDLIDKIKKIATYKDMIHISNMDATEFIIKKYMQIKNMLIYADPPYFEKGSSLYKHSYNYEQHKDLANVLIKIKSNWIVSYDNADAIVKIYSNINKRPYVVNMRHSANEKKKGNEIMFFSRHLKIPSHVLINKNLINKNEKTN